MSRALRRGQAKASERSSAMKARTRECGTCTACCVAKGVKALDKPAFERCRNLVEGVKGCSIYAARPRECADFECMWKLGMFAGADRPDRLGIVVDVTMGENREAWVDGQAFVVREALEGGLEKAAPFIEEMAARTSVVVVRADGTRTIKGPPEHVARAATYVKRVLPVVAS